MNDSRADFEAASRAAVREADRLSEAVAAGSAYVPRGTFSMTARQLAGYLESEELGARREALESIMGVQIVVVPGLPTDGAVLISRREDFLYPTPSRATVLTVVVMP